MHISGPVRLQIYGGDPIVELRVGTQTKPSDKVRRADYACVPKAELIASANTLLAKHADEPEPAPSQAAQPARPEAAEPVATAQPPQARAETPASPKVNTSVPKPAPAPPPKPAPPKELDIPL